MPRKKLKLFVWEDVLTDYTSGMMFAIAASADDAREKLLEKAKYLPKEDLAQTPDEYDITEPVAFFVYGGS